MLYLNTAHAHVLHAVTALEDLAERRPEYHELVQQARELHRALYDVLPENDEPTLAGDLHQF